LYRLSLQTSCQVALWIVIAAIAEIDLMAASPFGLSGYPGPPPGSPKIHCFENEIAISNAALSCSWTLKPFRPNLLRAEATGTSLALAGEAFQILTDRQNYAASELIAETRPRVTSSSTRPNASFLSARAPQAQVELPLRSTDGRLRVLWRASLGKDANYIRQEIEIMAAREACIIKEIAWLPEGLPDARIEEEVDGSPSIAGDFFYGAEDPHALQSRLVKWNLRLGSGERLTQSFVVGVAPNGQMRRAFLYYLERERAHPYRPFLHYNSWYDTAWQPFALNETNCLEAIRLFGQRFITPYHVIMDAMVFDDGWDDPKTLWQFHSGFPNGFAPLAALCRVYHTHLGVWLSPFGGYGEPKEQRLKFGREQGFEINQAGFSLAGPKYYQAFKNSCVEMIRKYGVNYFKFDGIATGSYAKGGAEYILDTEAMRRLMLELRAEEPNLYINLTTGSWPSPFWLRFADSLWRQGGDMGLAGKGTRQQQWLTYRDQETYRNIVRKAPLYPLNALMTQGVAYSRQGTAGDPTFNSAGFKDDVRAFFGSGTSLQELYLQPGKLTAEDWRVLADAAKWSRANADVLVDTHWIGNDPSRRGVYGYASWTPRKGIVTLRNPDDQPHDFMLDPGVAFELPAGARTNFTLKSPWPEDTGKPALRIGAGQPLHLTLKPFEVVVFEALP